jgi:hypothetical protein
MYKPYGMGTLNTINRQSQLGTWYLGLGFFSVISLLDNVCDSFEEEVIWTDAMAGGFGCMPCLCRYIALDGN